MNKVKSVMNWLLRTDADQEGEVRDNDFAPSGTVMHYVVRILVAKIAGPEGATATKRLKGVLTKIGDVQVMDMGKSLVVSKRKSSLEGLLLATKTGRDWLCRKEADILVWGSIDETSKQLTLRFLPLNGAPEGRPGAIGAGDEINLPLDYNAEVDDVIAAALLCASSSTKAGAKDDLVSKLNDYAMRVAPLGTIDIAGLDQVQLVTVLQAIANVMTTNARGRPHGLIKALEVYLRAVRLIPDDLLEGARQALLYNQYASALRALGAKSLNPEPFEKAVEAYQNAIKALSKTEHPHDWALTMIRLGLALYHLAGRLEQPKIMSESISALEQSLTVFTRETNPGRWSEIKNHIGVVMTSLGEVTSDNTMLDKAIEAFDNSLDIRKREQVVVLWAKTTNNMGAAAFALAKLTQDRTLMEQSALAFEGAIQVYRELGQENRAHIISKNLKRTQIFLSDLSDSKE